jgi:hypothetical protein
MWRWVGLAAAVALLAGGAAQGARSTAPANTSPPTISGTARQGETLTAGSGTWSGSTPITFAFRWQRCKSNGSSCSKISGGDGQTFRLGGIDRGRTIRVSVTATNSDGSASAVSAATAVVVSGDPVNTARPTISGTAKSGETLTASPGSWTGTGSISFGYQWRRCNAAGDQCNDVGDDNQKYSLSSGDVGFRIRVKVVAKNTYGSTGVNSDPTAAVAPGGPVPASTALPTISGIPRDNETLTASAGSWSNAPTRFAFQWLRCDTAGNNCSSTDNGQQYRVNSHDVGHTIRVTVSASNQYGSGSATSAPTAPATAALVAGASIPVQQVSPPQRLVVSAVKFTPSRLHTRSAFVGRFQVKDTRGNPVSGALVYALALPYGWVRNAPEVVTGGDGWATIQFFPTYRMPLRRGAVVFFVRARKPGDNPLAGVSTRRLVQVGIG